MKWTFFLLLTLMLACNKEDSFAPGRVTEGSFSSAFSTYKTDTCVNHGTQLEDADILFLYDISSSQVFTNGQIQSMLDAAGVGPSRFGNVRLMFAPIQGSTTQGHPVMAINSTGLGANVNIVSHPPGITGYTSTGAEDGLQRAFDIVDRNNANDGGNQVFRNNSNLFIILVSNEDNNAHVEYLGANDTNIDFYQTGLNLSLRVSKILNLKSQMNLNSLRLLSFVYHSSCKTGVTPGTAYRQASAYIYQQNGSSDQSASATPDSFDLCSIETKDIYSYVDSIANPIIIPFTQHRVHIANSFASFNPTALTIYKNVNGVSTELFESSPNDFDLNVYSNSVPSCSSPLSTIPCNDTVSGVVADFDTSFTGVPGLTGNGNVTYPGCYVVNTQPHDIHIGYAVTSVKPLKESIRVRIDGQEVPESSVNGWTFNDQNFYTNRNIRVTSPSNDTPAFPEVKRTGFMIKLHGELGTITNGESLVVDYIPNPNP